MSDPSQLPSDPGARRAKPYLSGMIRKLGSPYELAAQPQHLWFLLAMLMVMQSGRAFGSGGAILTFTLGFTALMFVLARPDGRGRMTFTSRRAAQRVKLMIAHPRALRHA